MIDTTKLLRYSSFLYFVFDYETCHLNLQSPENKPWQVSGILKKYIPEKGGGRTEELEKLNFYLKWPDLKLSVGAERVTNFNRKKYNEVAVDPKPILKRLDKIIYDDEILLIGHNVIGFDIYIHNIFRQLMGFDADYSFMDRVIDTHALSKLYKLEMTKPDTMTLLEWMVKILNTRNRGLKTNVKVMCKELDIPLDESLLHDSMYDIEKTEDIFLKLIWKMEI